MKNYVALVKETVFGHTVGIYTVRASSLAQAEKNLKKAAKVKRGGTVKVFVSPAATTDKPKRHWSAN